MSLVTIQQLDDTRSVIRGDGIQLTISTCMVDGYLKARRDIITLGEPEALQKWRREETVERRKLGLPADPLDIDEPHFIGWTGE